MRTFIPIIVCLFAMYCAISAQNIKCNQGEKLDLMIQRLFLFGAEDQYYPASKSEMKKFCRSAKEYQNWIKAFCDKCLHGLGKQAISLLMYSVNKNINAICKSRKRGDLFIQMGPCGNVAKEDTVKCWNTLSKNIDAIAYNQNDKLKIPLMCCNFFGWKSCNQKSYESYPKQCTSKAIDGHEKLVNAFALDALKLMCGDYTEDSDKCDKIIGETGKSRLKVLPKSPVLMAVKMLESMGV